MNYIKKAYLELKTKGVYYTPNKIENELVKNIIIANPPFKK